MTSRQYDPIDEPVAAEIERLHKKYPNLGHEGLIEALSQQGLDVDDQEMKNFLRQHGLNPGIIKRSWGWVASRWIPDLGHNRRGPPESRSERRFWRRR